MCGIAGFSIPSDARVNARLLSHALLAQIETRGTHASGFGYHAPGSMGVYKKPLPGSQLSLAEMPRDASAVVLHTRFATQGSVKDNRNNHPVMSTDNKIALVHNGVISNDRSLRGDLGITDKHGEVDSLVIPSLIAQHGMASLSRMSGYAAISWLDAERENVLNIARLKNSPVAYTWTFEGAFVFASTEALLKRALDAAGMQHGGVFDMQDGKYMAVSNGFIESHDPAPRMSYDTRAWNRHSAATSGGHGTTSATPATRVGDTVSGSENSGSGYTSAVERWRERQAAAGAEPDTNQDMTDEDWDYTSEASMDDRFERMIARLEREEAAAELEAEEMANSGDNPNFEGFYLLDESGDISHHFTLGGLEAQLRWMSNLTKNDYDLFQDLDEGMGWVNHIMDLGNVEEDGTLVSWVDDTGSIDDFESPAIRNLQYIREGAHMLATLKGA